MALRVMESRRRNEEIRSRGLPPSLGNSGEGCMALRVRESRRRREEIRSRVLPPSLGISGGRRIFIPAPSPGRGLQCETPDLNQNLC